LLIVFLIFWISLHFRRIFGRQSDIGSKIMSIRSTPDTPPNPLSDVLRHDDGRSVRLIADAIPQVIWIASAGGDLEYFNRSWFEFTGLAPDESLNHGWEVALHPDDRSHCRMQWLTAMQSGASIRFECRLRRASDGMYRWHLTQAHALKDETGATVKWVGSCTDIDDQKSAQLALHEAVADVERQVKERTAELLVTNMQLLDAISERRQAAMMQEQDTRRLNDIIATQAMLVQTDLDLSSFLNLAAQKIHHLTGATGTVVELIEGSDVVSAAASGTTVPFIGFRMRMEGSLSGACIRRRQILRCDNANEDRRVDLDACLRVGAVSLAVAPLYNKGEPIGALKILADTPAAFGQRDVQTLELMAGLLGAAVAQHVQRQSNERLLADRTDAFSRLRMEIDSRLRSEQQLREAEQRARAAMDMPGGPRLSANEKFWRTLADQYPAWIAYIDARRCYRFANAYYRKASGLNPADMIGRAVSDIIGDERYAAIREKIDEVLNGAEVHYERSVDRKGEVMRQHVHYIPDVSENGAVNGFYSIVTRIDGQQG
jgi:PAS domain S-box-containing protein